MWMWCVMCARNGTFALGLLYSCNKNTTLKAQDRRSRWLSGNRHGWKLDWCWQVKLEKDMSVSCAVSWRKCLVIRCCKHCRHRRFSGKSLAQWEEMWRDVIGRYREQIEQSQFEVKQTLSKGFTLLGGMKFDTVKGVGAHVFRVSFKSFNDATAIHATAW